MGTFTYLQLGEKEGLILACVELYIKHNPWKCVANVNVSCHVFSWKKCLKN